MPGADAFVELVVDRGAEAPQPLRLHAPALSARLGGQDLLRLVEEQGELRLEPPVLDFDGAPITGAPPQVALEVPGELRVLLDRLDRRVVAALPHRRVRVGMPQVYRGVGPMDFFLVLRGGF